MCSLCVLYAKPRKILINTNVLGPAGRVGGLRLSGGDNRGWALRVPGRGHEAVTHRHVAAGCDGNAANAPFLTPHFPTAQQNANRLAFIALPLVLSLYLFLSLTTIKAQPINCSRLQISLSFSNLVFVLKL